jgi:hypothetical protein
MNLNDIITSADRGKLAPDRRVKKFSPQAAAYPIPFRCH